MANYTSKYTGAQIDLAVSSGSSVSGKIIDVNLVSGSGISTGSLSRLEVADNADIKGVLSLPNISNVSSSIAAASLGGDNLGNHTATQALNMDGNSIISASSISASGDIATSTNITASGKIKSNDEFILEHNQSPYDTLVKIHGSSDNGVIDVYQNRHLKTQIHGNGTSIIGGGGLKVSGSTGFISASGMILSEDEFKLIEGPNGGGDTIARLYASSDDGVLDLFRDNTVRTRIHGNGTSFFQGSITASGDISASGKLVSRDEIILQDGTTIGDRLIRQYASGDDGVIDIYQNNGVVSRLHGNGISRIGGDLQVTGSLLMSGSGETLLDVRGKVSASGNIQTQGQISASGEIVTKDKFQLKEKFVAGDTLVKIYGSSDDGVIDVYQNNAVKSRIHGNGVSHLYGGGLLVSQSANATISASGRIVSGDSFLLKHGSNIDGDTRVKIYGSSDDGIIDVYQNNSVKARINGNGTSFLKGGGLQVTSSNGFISASGKIISGDEIILKDLLAGDTLVRQYASGDDGIIDVYQNNTVKIRLDGTDGSITASGAIETSTDISASGKIYSNDEFILKDGSPHSDTLVRQYASGDDGIIDIYQNNTVKNRINGNGVSYFQGGNVAIGGTSAPSPLTVVGNISASGGISASGNIYAYDEIILQDGAHFGDTLVRQYASGDDGIIDIYQNNTVKNRINGNGVSYFTGGNVAIGGTSAPSPLTVVGNISASNGISASGNINTSGNISSTGYISTDSHITASGNISASGTIFASKFESAGAASQEITFNDNLDVTGIISASGKIFSEDEIILKDGSPSGDLLIRQYASGDDGIIDIYQNNAVKNRINGNGLSYFQGGNVAIGTSNDSGEALVVQGSISASGHLNVQGDITSSATIKTDTLTVTETGSFGRVYATQDISSSRYVLGQRLFVEDLAIRKLFGGFSFGTDKPILAGNATLSGVSSSGDISASGKIFSDDEIHLRDGSSGGDTLVRQYASGDDGIIDVYQNNSVKNRINGNGLSYFQGGNVAIGTSNDSGESLVVQGSISASGHLNIAGVITASKLKVDNTLIDGDTIYATDLKIGEDAQTAIDFETVNEIHFDVNNVELLNLTGNKISGSKISTGSFGVVETHDSITAGGKIVAGNDSEINKSSDGADVSFTIRNSAAAGSTDETSTLKFGTAASSTTAKIVGGRDANYAVGAAADGNLQFYTRLNGTETEYVRITSDGNVGIGTTTPSKKLEVAGDISSSGDFFTDGTLAKYRRGVLGTLPNGHTLNVSSSGAVILQSTDGATLNLPAMGAALKGVQYTFVNAGSATDTWNLSPNSNDKIMGSCIDSNAIATVVEAASNGAGADNKDLQLDDGSGVGDRVTLVGDGADGWYIVECMGSFIFES